MGWNFSYAFDHVMGVAILRLQHGIEVKRHIATTDSKSQLFVETDATMPLCKQIYDTLNTKPVYTT